MKEKSPAFQWYPKEYLSDENVAYLTLEQEGAYTRLISHCWQEGSIPEDLTKMAQLCKRCDPAMLEPVALLFQKHPSTPGRLVHDRLERERLKQKLFRKERSESGLRGANKRWAKPQNSHSSAIAQPMALDSSASAFAFASPLPPVAPQNGDGLELYEWFKAEIWKLYNRPANDPVSFLVQEGLSQVSRRPNLKAELELIKKYKTSLSQDKKQSFPWSAGKLLEKWDGFVDTARGQKPAPAF